MVRHFLLFLLLGVAPIFAQTTQYFTGTVQVGGNLNGPGFFSTPDGTQVTGAFTVTTGNLGTPVNFPDYNAWSPQLNNLAANTDSITASGVAGSISVSALRSVYLSESFRAGLEYGTTTGPVSGAIAILCQQIIPNLPIDVTAFPLVIPPSCTSQVQFQYNDTVNRYYIGIDITNLSSGTPSAQLVDPVSSGFVIPYSGGSVIKPSPGPLSVGGTVVQGAAADGVTQLLLRIPATSMGQQFNLALLDETGSAGQVTANGGLLSLGANAATAKSTLSVAAVPTPLGYMAFAAYVAPIDFTRSLADLSAVSRSLSLQITTSGSASSSTPILLMRPPVILIHGLWGEPADWLSFTGLINATQFTVSTVKYNMYVPGIVSTDPMFIRENFSYIRGNSLGFEENAPTIEDAVRRNIKDYAVANNIAAVQADIVGHSMGGDMAKQVGVLPDFSSANSFGSGLFHKLITVGTPHLGSELATDLLMASNTCSRNVLGLAHMYSFNSVAIGSQIFNGAVSDLQGGTVPGPSLSTLHNSILSFPMAYIGAISSSTNWASLSTPTSPIFGPNLSAVIQIICGDGNGDAIANSLTSTGWKSLFSNLPSDSVVDLTSQMNGEYGNTSFVHQNVIHSKGLELLDFIGPAELDHSSGIDADVITLLNESATGSDFHPKGVPQ